MIINDLQEVKLVEYRGESTTVWQNRERVTLSPETYGLNFHPVVTGDSGQYSCLFNGRPLPESITKLVVQGKQTENKEPDLIQSHLDLEISSLFSPHSPCLCFLLFLSRATIIILFLWPAWKFPIPRAQNILKCRIRCFLCLQLRCFLLHAFMNPSQFDFCQFLSPNWWRRSDTHAPDFSRILDTLHTIIAVSFRFYSALVFMAAKVITR